MIALQLTRLKVINQKINVTSDTNENLHSIREARKLWYFLFNKLSDSSFILEEKSAAAKEEDEVKKKMIKVD